MRLRLLIATVLLAASTASHADTYQKFDLGPGHDFNPSERFPIGIEASGAVVIFTDPAACGQQAPPYICYETWVNGRLISKSPTNPYVYDNGTQCTPDAPAGFYIGYALCNNGHEVYEASLSVPQPPYFSIFTGPDPVTDFFGYGIFEISSLNSSGDFLYTVGPFNNGGEIFEAIDLTTTPTPEPASIFLLGTGALTALAGMRRRLLQHRWLSYGQT
jgi:hypothetical protein